MLDGGERGEEVGKFICREISTEAIPWSFSADLRQIKIEKSEVMKARPKRSRHLSPTDIQISHIHIATTKASPWARLMRVMPKRCNGASLASQSGQDTIQVDSSLSSCVLFPSSQLRRRQPCKQACHRFKGLNDEDSVWYEQRTVFCTVPHVSYKQQ